MRMRQLDRWSDSSLRTTAPRPCQGEPSRRMPRSFIRQVLEIAGVDHLEARQIGDLREPATGRYHGGGRFPPNVAVGKQPKMPPTDPLDRTDRPPPRQPNPPPPPL